MSIPTEQLDRFRKALDESTKPLFFFDGDADGLTSYALLYKYKGDGKGVMISGRPRLSEDFTRKYEEYQPDAVFILDLAQITQEFIDNIPAPIHWLDHHDPDHGLHLPKRMTHYNPRLHDPEDGRPTAYWAYQVTKQDLWVAMAGIVGDYHYDKDLASQLRKEHPGLLPEGIDHQGEALFDSPLGTIIRVLNFNLKGPVRTCMTAAKIVTRIGNPDEILHQTSPKGKYLYKRYERVMKAYKPLYEQAAAAVKEDEEVLVFIYSHDQYSLSGELANELKYRNMDKAIIVGRRHDGKVIMSLRSEHKEILGPLKKALADVEGYGGGHPKACGAVVDENSFEMFKETFKHEYENQ
ncbi:DHH family phosphoesterase [Candidatus Woesearchaeota archaeon]|nr:DHH family phosphoesterase [Candidatus Woesearchaeota archaeon]